ncbi:MAG: helix-turn-helix transcriptional regulator [Clostridia bacterium]
MVDFGNRLKLLRLNKKLTQAQLAERIGVTKSMISAYETSMRLPSFDVLIKLAYELKITTDYLLGVDKRNDLDIPSLTDKQKEAILTMINAFSDDNL